MNKDQYTDWEADNHDDLLERFLTRHPMTRDLFDAFCYDEFTEWEADKSDELYEHKRDEDAIAKLEKEGAE